MASGARAIAKRAVERALVRSGLAGWLLDFRGRSIAILGYHNVIPRGERAAGEVSLHLSQEAFGDQLDLLRETHAVVSLDEVGRPEVARETPQAIITFDDAYVGAMTAGLEELRKRDLAVTVFVNPGCLEWDGFWWDQLADSREGMIPQAVRKHALGPLRGVQEEVLAWAGSEGLRPHPLPPHAKPASQACLESAASYHGLTLASHTWSHASLPLLEPEEVRSQLRRAKSWLEERFGNVSEWMSYPYGARSRRTAEIAAEFHRGALLISGGATSRRTVGTDPYAIPRISVPSGLSLDGFVLRVTGTI